MTGQALPPKAKAQGGTDMSNNTALSDLRHHAKEAKPQGQTGNFKSPYSIQQALEAAADAIEDLQARVKALEDQAAR